METNSIKDAIKNAFETVKEKLSGEKKEESPKEETNGPKETKPDEIETSDEEEVPNEEEKPKFELSERDKQAIKLFDLLNDTDPNTVGATLQFLVRKAEGAGITIEGATKKEQKEVTKDILDELKEVLPEENQELIDALGPALRKMISKASEGSEIKVKELEKQLKEFTQKAEAANYASDIAKILNTDKYREHLPEMEKLMATVQPADGVNEQQYFDTLLKLAKANKPARDISKKTEKNAEEAIPSSTGKGSNIVVLDKPVSLKEAIKLAQEGKTVKYQ